MSERKIDAPDGTTNPLIQDINDDLSHRSSWADIDAKICRRRLTERKIKRTKPYPGAPNTVVPIIDDVVTELTDQQITMQMNAPRLAHFIPLDQMPTELRSKAEIAFDTYLRYMCNARPKFEDGMDCKNSRGFAVFYVRRTDHPRWGMIPDFDTVDLRDCIVPSNTKNIKDAERITHRFRFSERELRDIAKKKSWHNVEEVITRAKGAEADQEHNVHRETEHLTGIDMAPEDNETIEVYQCWHYANEWDVAKSWLDVKLGKKVCTTFSDSAPDLPLIIYAWKEEDTEVPLQQEKLQVEQVQALVEGREPVTTKTEIGPDREWPFIQPRQENIMGRLFYQTRGTGQKCSDDQVVATGLQNMKLTAIDYTASPMYESDGTAVNSANFTAEPGSILPQGLKPATMPTLPTHFDMTIDQHKRDAGRRMGAGSQYNFSSQMGERRKVEKTATEIETESARSGMVSSASVDRFNDPFALLYQQLWEDWRRIGRPIPMIKNTKFEGNLDTSVYQFNVLVIPSASSKTSNPDLQFLKMQQMSNWLAPFAQAGVPINFDAIARHGLAYYDPFVSDEFIINPNEQGPQGQPPIYEELQNIKNAINELAGILDAKTEELTDTQKLSVENSDRLTKEEERSERDREKARATASKAG